MKKISIISIFEYIIAILLIISCNTVYYNRNSTLLNVIFLGCIGAFLILYIFSRYYDKSKTKKVMANIAFYLLYLLIYILIVGIKNTDDKFAFIYIIVFPILYFYYYTFDPKKKNQSLVEKYVNVMVFLAIISLIFYFMITILGLSLPHRNIQISWGYKDSIPSYYNLYFETQKENVFGTTLQRNSGIFLEAPMYALNLILALSLELLFLKNKKNKNVIILCLAITTTISATGIIIMIVLLAYQYLFKNKSKSKVIYSLKVISIPIVIFLAIWASMNVFENKQGSASMGGRTRDYIACYYAWKENPIFGIGTANTNKVTYYSYDGDPVGYSNSAGMVLALGGIYLTLFYLYCMIKPIIKSKNRDIKLFWIINIILYIIIIYFRTFIMANFLALGLSNYNEKIEKR